MGLTRCTQSCRGRYHACDSIMPQMEKHLLVVINAALCTGKSTLAKKLCQDVAIQEHNSHIQWNVLYTSIVVKLELCDLTPLVQELSFFGLKQLMEVFQLVRWKELFRE